MDSLRSVRATPDGLLEVLDHIRQPVLYTHFGMLASAGNRLIPAAYGGESDLVCTSPVRPAKSLRQQQSHHDFVATATLITCLPPPLASRSLRRIAEAQALATLGDALKVLNWQVGAESQIARLDSGSWERAAQAAQVGRAHALLGLAQSRQWARVYERGGQSVRERYLWAARVIVGPGGGEVDVADVAELVQARGPHTAGNRLFPVDALRRDFAVREVRSLLYPRTKYLGDTTVLVHPWPLNADQMGAQLPLVGVCA